jgi:tRNA-specific 2-thiouridylase
MMDQDGSNKVLVAMSGGVDSSVAALLLQRGGYEVSGITMCIAAESGAGGRKCCSPEDITDARRVCSKLGIAHHVLSMSAEMERSVVRPFLEEYRRGRTPNPCILCNEHIKFRALIDSIAASGTEILATGHYARISREGGRPALARPRDRTKDQTYFLYSVDRERLGRVIFPLGELRKEEVRKIASEAGLPVSEKRESQDFCLWPEGGGPAFFESRGFEPLPGDIVSVDGDVIGRHEGIFNYTVGQRRGLGISAAAPLYVLSIAPETNTVVAGEESHLYSRVLTAEPVNFLPGETSGRAEGKIRYAHGPEPCEFILSDGILDVRFDEPQRAITPGQSIVLYRGDLLIGGGIIGKPLDSL